MSIPTYLLDGHTETLERKACLFIVSVSSKASSAFLCQFSCAAAVRRWKKTMM